MRAHDSKLMKLRRLLLAPLWAIVAAPAALGQLPGAKLNYVFPPGAQAGSSLEISVDGGDLNGARLLEFSHPGILGEPVMAPGDEWIKRPQWQRNRFTVTVAPDVPPGVYHAWFVGRYGISNTRAFVVGDLPQLAESVGNDTREKAAEIKLNSVVVGRVDGGKSDCFKIALKPGRMVVFDCQAKRLGSRLDAQLAIFDPSGKPLVRKAGAGDRDPVIVFDPPAEGTYFVELSDFLSAGGADRSFRLVVSDRPFIESVFPPAGIPGSRSLYRLSGANLPGGADELEVEIELPAEAPPAGRELALHPRELTSIGAIYRFENSNPVRIPFATAPVIVEELGPIEQEVVPPCEIAGSLAPAADSDAFVFAANKGDDWIVEAISHRAGHASDLQLTISQILVDAEGKRSEKKVAEADDDTANIGGRRAPTSSRDPILRFTAPEDGRYILRLIDQFQLGDPNAAYRLAIRQPAPDFSLLAEIANPITENKRLQNWSPTLLSGGRLPIEVRALRRDGFDGEIQLSVGGVPSGVEVFGGEISKGKNSGSIILSGSADLAEAVGVLEIVGKSGDIERRALAVVFANEVGDFDREVVVPRLGDPLLLATRSEVAPVSMSAGVPALVETSIGGSIEIPLKLAKEGTFKGNAKIYLAGLPNIAKPASLDVDLNKVADGKLTVALKPSNENKYAPGRYEVYTRADAVLQYRPDPQAGLEASEDLKAVEALAVEAGEALKLVEAKRGEIAQAGLTEDERASQSAAAEEAISLAQARKKAADEAKARAAELLKQAEARNAPRDLRLAAYSAPFVLDIAPAPLLFKEVPPELQVSQGGQSEISVGFERRFGFAENVELSLVPPKDLKGFELPPVTVAKDPSRGSLIIRAAADAPVGEHLFTLVAKVNFNGVACDLQQPLKVVVVAAAATPSPPVAPSGQRAANPE